MELDEIREFVARVDPTAQHQESTAETDDYTVWYELEPIGLQADDGFEPWGWRFVIEHWAVNEMDDVARGFIDALTVEDIPYTLTVDYDMGAQLIQYKFTCEGV